ncbi:hypothetical protein AQUCO_00200784v1 [Aquilegia coerulea]|uniref:BAG domain-containing protein n=1 Tax=Aquilegia coerulea TaxID=218851 RepID=A0A2G5F4P5_AQUCA|nr:hypothetical protein AQUCO_00200784v1 [Aquilegia coerulea]
MASHHHCQCHHQQQQQNHCYSSCCSSSSSSNSCNCSSSFHSHHQQPIYSQPSPQLSPSDPLVQAIATQLLQSSQSHLFNNNNNNNKPHHHQQQQHKHHKQQEQEKTQALFTSLLRRVVALESSFNHFSSSPSSPSSTPSSSSSPPRLSLKDIAARTIQTHFRAYLVRRSRTLRHLKHLAIIKSNLNSLKSSVSENTHFNSQAISQKAIDLLHKLDFIQGADPMIRDGKRSISRDLVRFLEFVDGISAKRQQLASKSMKAVRFADEIEESRIYMSTQEPFSCENVGDFDDEQGISSDDQIELVEKLTKKIGNIEGFSRVYEDDDEETGSEGSSSKLSNGDTNPRINLKTKVNYGKGNHFQSQNGNSLYSAPLPVHMEPIRVDEQMKREKIVRVDR